MSGRSIAGKILIPAGIGAAGFGTLGALTKPPGRTKEQKRKNRIRSALGLGAVGGVLGGAVGLQFLDGGDFRRAKEWDGNFGDDYWDNFHRNQKEYWDDFNKDQKKRRGPWDDFGDRKRQPPPPSSDPREAVNVAKKYGLPKKPKTKVELKKAYRAAALKWHPDRAKPEDRMKYNAVMSDLNRWNEYWIDKVAFWHSFKSELAKIAESSL